MDRLAEISRPNLSTRPEVNDFTRARPARNEQDERSSRAERPEPSDKPERREASQTRVKEAEDTRERATRASEKSERFSDHLQEHQATLEPNTQAALVLDSEASAESQPVTKPTDENDETAALELAPSEPRSVVQAPETSRPKLTPAPAPELALPGVERAPVPPPTPTPNETPRGLEKLEITPAMQPLPDVAALTDEAPSSALVETSEASEPVTSAAPGAEAERAVLEADSGLPKPATPPGEARPAPAASFSVRELAQVEARPIEAPRETPMARTAHEIERAADILRQVRVQITPQLHEARIQLHPVELGRVSIHITFEEGRAKTSVRAERRDTLAALEMHLPELRASLRQHGIDAQDFQLSLGFDSPKSGEDKPTSARSNARETSHDAQPLAHTRSLHAAVATTGVDLYA